MSFSLPFTLLLSFIPLFLSIYFFLSLVHLFLPFSLPPSLSLTHSLSLFVSVSLCIYELLTFNFINSGASAFVNFVTKILFLIEIIFNHSHFLNKHCYGAAKEIDIHSD